MIANGYTLFLSLHSPVATMQGQTRGSPTCESKISIFSQKNSSGCVNTKITNHFHKRFIFNNSQLHYHHIMNVAPGTPGCRLSDSDPSAKYYKPPSPLKLHTSLHSCGKLLLTLLLCFSVSIVVSIYSVLHTNSTSGVPSPGRFLLKYQLLKTMQTQSMYLTLA